MPEARTGSQGFVVGAVEEPGTRPGRLADVVIEPVRLDWKSRSGEQSLWRTVHTLRMPNRRDKRPACR